jgi:predicted amidohydrolase
MVEQEVTLAAVCMVVEHNKQANLEKIINFIEEAAQVGTRLIVFPECCLQGYLWTWDWERHCLREDVEQDKYFYKTAEPIPGPSTKMIASYAAKHNMTIQLGLVEKTSREDQVNLYNSVAIVGPTGLLGKFRKVHNPPSGMILQGGDVFEVFNTDIGKVGPIICADIQYPEALRVLMLKGAEVVTMSAAWGLDPKTDQSGYIYDLLTRANALMNGIWIVVGAQTGAPQKSSSPRFGHARIINPMGEIVAGTGYNEGLVTAKVDVPTGIESSLRQRFLGRRSPKSYRIIVK